MYVVSIKLPKKIFILVNGGSKIESPFWGIELQKGILFHMRSQSKLNLVHTLKNSIVPRIENTLEKKEAEQEEHISRLQLQQQQHSLRQQDGKHSNVQWQLEFELRTSAFVVINPTCGILGKASSQMIRAIPFQFQPWLLLASFRRRRHFLSPAKARVVLFSMNHT